MLRWERQRERGREREKPKSIPPSWREPLSFVAAPGAKPTTWRTWTGQRRPRRRHLRKMTDPTAGAEGGRPPPHLSSALPWQQPEVQTGIPMSVCVCVCVCVQDVLQCNKFIVWGKWLLQQIFSVFGPRRASSQCHYVWTQHRPDLGTCVLRNATQATWQNLGLS